MVSLSFVVIRSVRLTGVSINSRDSEQLVKELSDKLSFSFSERDQLKSQCSQLESQVRD